MSQEQTRTVTILTEGNKKTNGSNDKPTTPKPKVQPAGQQPQKTNGQAQKQ